MRWFWNFLTTDLWRKVLALILTGCVYFSISELQRDNQPLKEVPLKITASTGLFVPKDKREPKVTLTLRGDPSRLNKISPKEMEGTVSADQENQIIQLKSDNFPSLSDVKIVEIKPAKIETGARPLEKREVKVVITDADVAGTPDAGYRRENIIVEPATVKVTGPADELRKLEKIRLADRVNVRGSHDFWESRMLSNPDPDLFEISPSSVVVQVNIRQKEEESKDFDKIPIHLLFNPLGRERVRKVEQIYPLSAKVTVRGNRDALRKISAANIVLFADLTSAAFDEPGLHNADVSASLQGIPEGSELRIETVSEKQIRVLIAPPPGKRAEK